MFVCILNYVWYSKMLLFCEPFWLNLLFKMIALYQFYISKAIFRILKMITSLKSTWLRINKIFSFGHGIFRKNHCIIIFYTFMRYLFWRVFNFSMIRWIWYTSSARRSKHLIISILFTKFLNFKRLHVLIIANDSIINQLKWEDIFALFSLGSFFILWLFYLSLCHLCSTLCRN